MQPRDRTSSLIGQMFSECHNRLGRSEDPVNYAGIMESVNSSITELQKVLPEIGKDERKLVLFEAAKQLDLLRARFRESKKAEMTEHKKGFVTFLNERMVMIIALLLKEEKDWQLVKRIDQMITPIYYFEREKVSDAMNSKVPWTPVATIDQEYAVEIFSKRFESVLNRNPELREQMEEYKKFLEQSAPKIE